MLKPLCIPCQRFFRPEKNGFYFIEGMPIEEGVEPGTSMPDRWKPYKLWVGDKWECQGCGAQIVVGVPSTPIAEHFHEDFNEQVERLWATYQVNDC